MSNFLASSFRRIKNNIRVVLWTATVPILLGVYQTGLASAIQLAASNAWAWAMESPMPDNYLIRIDLQFGVPSNTNGDRVERKEATLWPGRCKYGNGDTLTRALDSQQNSYQNVILQVTCNYAGRTKVTLTPAVGDVATIYDGYPKGDETHPFPGVQGSYRLGQVHISRIYNDSKWVPVNKCQLMKNCEEIDPMFPD